MIFMKIYLFLNENLAIIIFSISRGSNLLFILIIPF